MGIVARRLLACSPVSVKSVIPITIEMESLENIIEGTSEDRFLRWQNPAQWALLIEESSHPHPLIIRVTPNIFGSMLLKDLNTHHMRDNWS